MGDESSKMELDHRSGIPLYVQLKNRLRYEIQSGKYAPGEQLPTIREMAVANTVDVNTVARAYAELESEGMLERMRGKGTFVRDASKSDSHADTLRIAREAVASTIELLKGLNLSEGEIAALLQETGRKLSG